MTSLQLVFKQGAGDVVMTDSKRLAEGFGSRHDSILRKIDGILAKTDKEFRDRNFVLSSYRAETGNGTMRDYMMYEMTRDGFMHIALTFTNTEKGNAFRVRVIEAFNAMEAELTKRHAQLPFDLNDTRSILKWADKEFEKKDLEIAKERTLRIATETVATSFQNAVKEIDEKPVTVLKNRTLAAVDIKDNPLYPQINNVTRLWCKSNPEYYRKYGILGAMTKLLRKLGCDSIRSKGPSGHDRNQFNRADIDATERNLMGTKGGQH
jgi:Rha family phage regulatory protein